MTSFTTFYLSRIIGRKVYDAEGKVIGVVKDLLILFHQASQTFERPVVIGIRIRIRKTDTSTASPCSKVSIRFMA